MNCRRGLSLVELLVVIAIVSLLLALTVPAIQRVRESARQTTCKNRLHQLVLGMESFHALHRRYPPSQLFGEHGKGADSTAWGWMARVLPQVEQQALYDRGGIPQRTLRQSGIADVPVEGYLCPSDGWDEAPVTDQTGNLVQDRFRVALTNYKAVMGANWGADESQRLGPGEIGTRWNNRGSNGSYDGLNNADGIMFRADYREPRRHANVVDGLSQTFVLGEALPEWDAFTSWPYANGNHSTCAIPPNYFGDAGESRYWWPNMQSFRSLHPGGLHFAFADGAVRFVHDSIDLALYRGLATIDGGETSVPPD